MTQPDGNSAIDGPRMPADVCILLAVHNGASYLQAQLDSYLAQTHARWSLIIADDGSCDASPDIVTAFAVANPDRDITLIHGAGQGVARNFMMLLQTVPQGVRFAALSDQDDVWFPDKLARALAHLGEHPAEIPALYCAATLICDENLKPVGRSTVFTRAPDFRNALVQSIGGGNTMVLNRAAIDLAARTAGRVPDPVMHDWWLYQVVSGYGGIVLRDPSPVLKYRQHDANAIGANVTVRARLARVGALWKGRFRRWNQRNLAALDPLQDNFTKEARTRFAHFRAAREGPVRKRLRHLRASGVFRQSKAGTIALYLACLLRRL